MRRQGNNQSLDDVYYIRELPSNSCVQTRKQKFSSSNSTIHVSRFKGTGPFVCHIEGTYLRGFSKQELQHLIEGYLPYYRETVPLGGGVDHEVYSSAITGPEDLPRAGWIVAVGLFMNRPVPLYADGVGYTNKETGQRYSRGGLFYRLFQRTISVLENIIKPAFPGEPNVSEVIQCIKYMVKNETESGVKESPWGRVPVLSSNQCTEAFVVFNGSPCDNLTPRGTRTPKTFGTVYPSYS